MFDGCMQWTVRLWRVSHSGTRRNTVCIDAVCPGFAIAHVAKGDGGAPHGTFSIHGRVVGRFEAPARWAEA